MNIDQTLTQAEVQLIMTKRFLKQRAHLMPLRLISMEVCNDLEEAYRDNWETEKEVIAHFDNFYFDSVEYAINHGLPF